MSRSASRLALVAAAIVAVRHLPAQPAAHAVVRPVASSPAARSAARPSPARLSSASSSVTIEREVFSYAGAGRRDPFKSLMTSTTLRPALADLRLVAVAYDAANGASVAILRELATKTQHRVRVGTPLGRMRVAAIRPRSVVFSIEELGYSRQETLSLTDSTAVRSR